MRKDYSIQTYIKNNAQQSCFCYATQYFGSVLFLFTLHEKRNHYLSTSKLSHTFNVRNRAI